MNDRELKARAAKIEALVEELESCKAPGVRTAATELLQELLQFYGNGLARMTEIVAHRDIRILDDFAKDELIAHLLLLHNLHPAPLETRIALALEEVRPYLQSHGGNVELLGITGGTVRLRLHGSCRGCPSSAMTLKLAINEAIRKAAPDLEGIEVDGVTINGQSVGRVTQPGARN